MFKLKENGTLVSTSEIEFGDTVVVELEYVAARKIKNAHFTISLDDAISFATNYEKINEEKVHSWTGELKKGVNKIPFVVTIDKQGSWEIDTKAEFEGYSHKHKIVISVKGGRVTVEYFKFNKVKTVS